MKDRAFLKVIVFCIVLALAAQLSAQPARRGGLYGDWQVTVDYDGRQMQSILSFSRSQEANWTGQWISFWGLSPLENVKYEEGQLSFAWSRRNRDGETTTSQFTGKVEQGKLTGTLSSDRGENAVQGQRSPRVPRAVGSWAMKLQMGEQEITSTLAVKADAEGALTARWRSERGELEMIDVRYEQRKLTFKAKSDDPDRSWEAAFEGTIQGDTLTGAIISGQGEVAAEGQRIGAALIGTWNLELTSERGTRPQRLRVNADMTGLYGAMPVKAIKLEGDQVSFKITRQFGERTFEMDFAGKLDEAKLTGEMTTSRGAQKVTGTKVVRTFRRRTTQ